MKRHRWTLILSLLANAALLIFLYRRETDHNLKGFLWTHDSTNWAHYAGALQADADYANGLRRIYHRKLAASPDEQTGFTGEHEGPAEVWSWVYQPNTGEEILASTEAFTDGYNNRMKLYFGGHKSVQPPTPTAATTSQPAP